MTNVITRRSLLHSAVVGGAATMLAACTSSGSGRPTRSSRAPATTSSTDTAATPSPQGNRTLLAYFSRPGENYWNGGRRTLNVGNTELLATMISTLIACDVHRIEAVDPYSDDYDDTVARNVREQNANSRPRIAGTAPSLAGYDTVLLGSPIWNVRPPMIMSTFVESVDLAGTRLLPFVTYAVSGLGTAQRDYERLAPNATVLDGLAVRGETVPEARADVEQWLRGTELL